MLGHPDLIEFNTKYKALLQHYRNGDCTMQQVLEVIELLDKYNLNDII